MSVACAVLGDRAKPLRESGARTCFAANVSLVSLDGARQRLVSSWPISWLRISFIIRQAVGYDTPISRSSCLAEIPQRVLVIRYIAKYQRWSDVEDLWKIVPAVGWT